MCLHHKLIIIFNDPGYQIFTVERFKMKAAKMFKNEDSNVKMLLHVAMTLILIIPGCKVLNLDDSRPLPLAETCQNSKQQPRILHLETANSSKEFASSFSKH